MTTHAPNLTGVPETMLWTLHNRATEAQRPDGIIRDAQAIRIYQSLDYNYERSFGRADASHAVRSICADEQVRAFLAEHPDGVIVNLGEGLETQRFRIPGDRALWLSVDLPEVIAIRERFIQPDENHRHIPLSATDHAWFDEVPRGRPVYITAQGLLMYLPEQVIRALFIGIAERFSSAGMLFDTIPPWFPTRP